MPTHIYLAPVAHGKTEAMLKRARSAATGLRARPLICVPTVAQARSARRRLALMGGAIGCSILTIDDFCHAVFRSTDADDVALGDGLAHSLMHDILREMHGQGALPYYQPLLDSRGFAAVALKLVEELKHACINPAAVAEHWPPNRSPARLSELGAIYATWQQRLDSLGRVDKVGLAWLAVDALDQGRVSLPGTWSPLIFDGFDSFTGVQLALLDALHRRQPRDLWITLSAADSTSPIARATYPRFEETRRLLEETLGVVAEPLPDPERRPPSAWAPPLLHIQRSLFQPSVARVPSDGSVTMIEATTPALEVREALRWVKERIQLNGIPPAECAIVAGNLAPYRTFLDATAREFGVPVRFEEGLPLARNPAIAAILLLLRAVERDESGEPRLPRREVVSLWRCPYFSWEQCGLHSGDIELLDQVAGDGNVVGGAAAWRVALAASDPGPAWEPDVMAADAATFDPVDWARTRARLLDVFACFVDSVTPPRSATLARFVDWLCQRLGGPAESLFDHESGEPAHGGVDFYQNIQAGAGTFALRDVAATDRLHEILGGLLEGALLIGASASIEYEEFVATLAAAIEAGTYDPPVDPDGAIFVGAMRHARGIPFRATALLGLAEGEMPGHLGEDPFLRDGDRLALRATFPTLSLPTQGAEQELFLESLARPSQCLLLTRPRLAEGGAAWEPSPYWEAVAALVDLQPEQVRSGQPVPVDRAATFAELLSAQALTPDARAAHLITCTLPGVWDSVEQAARTFDARRRSLASPHDGDLAALRADLTERFGPSCVWSASALQTYLDCPYHFLSQRLLGLQAVAEPEDELSGAALGAIYHMLFKTVYDECADPSSLDSLLATLDARAPSALEAAPNALGFRRPPGWKQLQAEIIDAMLRSLATLAREPVTDIRHEVDFVRTPIRGNQADEETLLLSGRIDRLDRLPDGTLRVVDYKSAKSGYTRRDVEADKKIQIPLYALAAERLFPAETVSQGFYFKVRGATFSDPILDVGQGKDQDTARSKALAHVRSAIAGVRAGDFAPKRPGGGCPDYCPAAAFCWHFERRFVRK